MTLTVSTRMTATALSLVLLSLAGCSAPEPEASLPPPPPPESYYTGPADLAGGPAQPPPPRYEQGLAGGPVVTAMAPIANPEDLPEAERHRIYGDKYDHLTRRGPRERRVRQAERAYAQAPASARPTTPVAPAPSRPAASAPAAKPAAAAPAAAAKAPATPVLDPAAAKLQAAVGPQVSSGATLTVDAALSERKPGPVALTLPQTLFDVIRKEAAKVGLGRAARSTEVSATLSGQGYEITPNGAQTVKLQPGEAPAFKWQVTPGAGELGPLSAKIAATLNGQRKPVAVPLATLEKAAPITEPTAGEAGDGEINIPGIGKVRAQTLLGGGLVLLAIVLLIALARNAAEAKEAARRRRSDRLREVETHPEPAAEVQTPDDPKPEPGPEDRKS